MGSFIFSYSAFAAVAAALEVTADFDRDACKGTRGCSSAGVDGPEELAKREPPSSGFFPLERDLSIPANRSVTATCNNAPFVKYEGKKKEVTRLTYHRHGLLPLLELGVQISSVASTPPPHGGASVVFRSTLLCMQPPWLRQLSSTSQQKACKIREELH